jgi:pimeloyl-ACP methyl ester carboxylesterase
MKDVTHHHADLGDVILHYITAGEGFPLVLLHGIPQTCHEWRYVMPALSKKFRVIAPDLRGLGDSSHPVSGYDKKTMSDDMMNYNLNIVSIRIRNMIINHDIFHKYIAILFEINKLKNLVEIDLGYTEFSQLSLRIICRTLNPIISGYCAIKRLVFTNVGIGKTGIKALFQAIECNEFIEEVLVSGNNGTDDSMTEIIATLLHDTNKIRIKLFSNKKY